MTEMPGEGLEAAVKRLWQMAELLEHWSVPPDDRQILRGKEKPGRLGLVAQLALYRLFARFPQHRGEFAQVVISHLAEQGERSTKMILSAAKRFGFPVHRGSSLGS